MHHKIFFIKNWDSLVKDLMSVGYPMKHITHVEEKLSYENRQTIMQEMDDKAKAKAEAGWQIDSPEISTTIISLILSARPFFLQLALSASRLHLTTKVAGALNSVRFFCQPSRCHFC